MLYAILRLWGTYVHVLLYIISFAIYMLYPILQLIVTAVFMELYYIKCYKNQSDG